MTDIPEVGEDWFKKARLRMPTDIRTEVREALDYREVWFIYSPRDEPWANIRIATFTKAVNRPHLELVVIHNEVGSRMGVRVWEDIVESEGWIKVKPIEIPTPAEVMAASIRAKEQRQ
jgi:hypothetical protein